MMQRRDFLKTSTAAASLAVLPASGGTAEPATNNASATNPIVWGQDGWHRWRGPFGNNHCAPGATAPHTITPDHYLWITPVPGRGHSSPIVTADSVFLTTAEATSETHSVLAFERLTGRPRWTRIVHQGGFPDRNHPKNTEASSTLAFDGQHLFAVFYHAATLQLTKLTPEGAIVWQQNLGAYHPKKYEYGYAASPLLHGDHIIVAGEWDGDAFLTARNRTNGREAWRIARPRNISFSSPIVAHTGGRQQLLISGAERVSAYDPDSGEPLWETPCTTAATCGTMVWNDQFVFASGGYPKKETACLDAATGEIVWTNAQKCYEQSMLQHDGYLYAVADSGVAYCWRADDGRTMWRQRLGGDYSSSPILVGESIHVFNEQGEGFAFRATPEDYQELGRSKVGDDVFATPSVVGNTMFLRVAKRTAAGRQESLIAIQA